MKHIMICMIVTVSLAGASLALSDESNDGSRHVIKDSAITTKVKAKLAAKHLATLTHIKVDTDENGVVWLTGRVPTQDASDLASMIAKNTAGVNSVHNNIAVEP